MRPHQIFLFSILFLSTRLITGEENLQTLENEAIQKPLVYILITARDKELSLPYFLTYFDKLTYPTDRLMLHIRADHCRDNTIDILEDWLSDNRHKYRHVNATLDRSTRNYPTYEGSRSEKDFYSISHLIKIKSDALRESRLNAADYFMMLDTDVFLMKRDVIEDMIRRNYTLVAPLLQSIHDYANFWHEMNSDFYFEGTDAYDEIFHLEKKGCFDVALVHSCVLLDLKNQTVDEITFDPRDLKHERVPFDDTVTFSLSAYLAGIQPHICNDDEFGLIGYPQPPGDSFANSRRFLRDLKVRSARCTLLMNVSAAYRRYLPPLPDPDKAGLSEIYYVNLDRRPDRREQLEYILSEVGLSARRVSAVDGETLTPERKAQLGVEEIEEYRDIVLKRRISRGEMGCTITHYNIWNDILQHGHQTVSLYLTDLN